MTIRTEIEWFLADAAAGAPLTRRTYRTGLNRFQEYLLANGLDPEVHELEVLQASLVLGWASWLTDVQGVNRRTLLTYLSAIMSFISWLQVRDLQPIASSDYARLQEGMRRLRRNQKPPELVPHPPEDPELNELLLVARRPPSTSADPRERLAAARNTAILETLLSTGMRVGELVALRTRELDEADGSAWVTGKRGRTRKVFFATFAWQSTTEYLRQRHSAGLTYRGPLGDQPVFARHDRRAGTEVLPLSTGAVQRMFRKLAQRAGLDLKDVTPHALRHYFGTRMYRATSDLAVTQTALGHASPVTTRIYAKLADSAVQEAHREAFGDGQPPTTSPRSSSDRSQVRDTS
ncbi:MAG: tyrosine-type recombinase/integrase [Caldilineaceae bacterium]|nr:tyrosine-type recombinase/integrase [Caldilineaceae bacterium]